MKTEAVAERAEHAHHSGDKRAALVIAVFAAALALCEQQAKRADIAVEENAILAADTWNEYQAKSVRSAVSRDLERLATSLDMPARPELIAVRQDVLKSLRSDQAHYETDEKAGKAALAERARRFEELRQHSLEKAHTFDNSAAALELGIVLATASVITGAVWLLNFSLFMGAIGVILGMFGVLAPELVVF